MKGSWPRLSVADRAVELAEWIKDHNISIPPVTNECYYIQDNDKSKSRNAQKTLQKLQCTKEILKSAPPKWAKIINKFSPPLSYSHILQTLNICEGITSCHASWGHKEFHCVLTMTLKWPTQGCSNHQQCVLVVRGSELASSPPFSWVVLCN